MFKSIMWATDGSAAADQAMPYVKALASDSGAEVVVFHADPLLMGRAGGQHEITDEDSVEAKIARQAGELRDAGLKAGEQLIHVGDGESPAQTIAQAAKELHADVIVVGTRGRTALAGLLLGGTTNRLLHIAPCPVLAVPAGKGDSAAADPEASTAAAQ